MNTAAVTQTIATIGSKVALGIYTLISDESGWYITRETRRKGVQVHLSATTEDAARAEWAGIERAYEYHYDLYDG